MSSNSKSSKVNKKAAAKAAGPVKDGSKPTISTNSKVTKCLVPIPTKALQERAREAGIEFSPETAKQLLEVSEKQKDGVTIIFREGAIAVFVRASINQFFQSCTNNFQKESSNGLIDELISIFKNHQSADSYVEAALSVLKLYGQTHARQLLVKCCKESCLTDGIQEFDEVFPVVFQEMSPGIVRQIHYLHQLIEKTRLISMGWD